jgi:hypothetical protein
MASASLNLEVIQQALGFRFGDHQQLKVALGVRGDAEDRAWLAEVGRAAVVSVLCEQGPKAVREFLSSESLAGVAAKSSLADADAVCCVLGAIRLDVSHKKRISELQGVFAGLFDVPMKDSNREFTHFHNALLTESSATLQQLLAVNPALVHGRTKKDGSTALMLVLTNSTANAECKRVATHETVRLGENHAARSIWFGLGGKGTERRDSSFDYASLLC